MELILLRTYYSNGTNGLLLLDNKKLCNTIELPWRDNHSQVSCIPEGCYPLIKWESPRHGWCLMVTNVPNRSLILIHPANNALRDLRGCIAPVTTITGPGCGDMSRAVYKPLIQQVYAALDQQHSVTLNIKKYEH